MSNVSMYEFTDAICVVSPPRGSCVGACKADRQEGTRAQVMIADLC